MSGKSASKAESERRRSPRAQTRLHGRVLRGRERIRVRIVDVSEGGVCLLCPVWLDPKKPFPLEIDVPGRGVSLARIEIWHIRREKSRVTNNKVWVAGALLSEADGTYAELLAAAGLASRTAQAPPPEPARAPAARSPKAASPAPASSPGTSRGTSPTTAPDAAADAAIDAAEPRIFRLRCKATGSPRTRLLSIAADSEAEALSLARKDLGAEWSVLEALEA